MSYEVVKWLHVMSSTVLFGTGLGSAYYMLAASRTRDARTVATTVRHVVIADWIFTTPTVVLQPLTGLWLVHLTGASLGTRWVAWSLALYVVAGAAWLPVVWMQIRMRDMAASAAAAGAALPARYWTCLRTWTALGVVAFSAIVAVFYLMVAKPG